MNERILELLVQSGLLMNVSEHRVGELDPNIKKFAELIVAECAGYVIGAAEVYTQEEQDACERAAVGLMNYFGVEE